MSGHWLIVRTRREWADQVRQALEDITAANGGTDPPTIRASYDVHPVAFGRMIEGLLALGVPVGPELTALAGMHDIGEVLG